MPFNKDFDFSKIVSGAMDEIFDSQGLLKRPLQETYIAQVKSFDLPTEKLSFEQKEAHKKLYEQYIRAFNSVSVKIESVSRDNVNPNDSEFRSLKLDEVKNRNAVYLHELYFANLTAAPIAPRADMLSILRLNRDFGTFDDWQKDFLACGMAAQQGWVVTYFDLFFKRYHNMMIDSHSNNIPVGSIPLIVIDVWEHSYFKDYVIDKKSYFINMMRELDWGIIEERFVNAEKFLKN